MKISVIMPVYNGESSIYACLDSLLFNKDDIYELIIINDGSKDNSESIILKFESLFNKFIYIQHYDNLGICKSLNAGINASSGDWIARMDSDDICLKRRFKQQFDFCKKNSLDFCFQSSYKFDSHKKLLKFIRFENPMIHPSLFIKGSIMRDELYSLMGPAQDYELLTRLVKKYQFKINEFEVVKLGESDNQITKKNRYNQDYNKVEISNKLIFLGSIFNFVISITAPFSIFLYEISDKKKVGFVKWVSPVFINKKYQGFRSKYFIAKK